MNVFPRRTALTILFSFSLFLHRVVLLEIPSRQELCTKNLFSVAEICLTWHEQGDFLAVQVLRCAKKKVDTDKQVKYMVSNDLSSVSVPFRSNVYRFSSSFTY